MLATPTCKIELPFYMYALLSVTPPFPQTTKLTRAARGSFLKKSAHTCAKGHPNFVFFGGRAAAEHERLTCKREAILHGGVLRQSVEKEFQTTRTFLQRP